MLEKRLYLDEHYLGFELKKSKEQTGEQLGGNYVARIQTGIEKDGSPQYRYFTTQAEYDTYLTEQRAKKKGKGKKGSDKKDVSIKERLQAKLKQEQEASSRKTKASPSRKLSAARSKKRSMFGGDKTKKSLTLYLGDIDVK